MLTIATVQRGHSEFDDAVYAWLNQNHARLEEAFRVDRYSPYLPYGSEFDYGYALIFFLEAGCSIQPLAWHDDGELTYAITYPGAAAALVERLDDLLACREPDCTAPRELHGHCDGCHLTLPHGESWCGSDGCLPF